MPSDIYSIDFHTRSNAGIMAGNRDPVNQSGTSRIALSEVENLITLDIQVI